MNRVDADAVAKRTADGGWWPTRRRMREALPAVVAPVMACAVALAGLTVWTASGAAGGPPQIAVADGRVFLPYGQSADTAAFFEVTNIGRGEDRLTKVTSPSPSVERVMLSRHESSGRGADTMGTAGSATIPAGATLSMSPFDVSVMMRVTATWEPGEIVPFTLHFRHSPPVEVVAVVVRPSD
ncbi:copper chaperone PCu(A)C [Streptomyces sp. NPDC047014]|uniref:copper chaperone PCu(A)C n=1 Tax=Streptomyces sp. NPDC047014 TaxID=3155736 RepID=UPI0033FE9587